MTEQTQWTSVPVDTARKIEAICTEFEESGRGGMAAIEPRLEGFHGHARELLLRELIVLDLELRARPDRAGLADPVEDYARFQHPRDRALALRAWQEVRQPKRGGAADSAAMPGFEPGSDMDGKSRERYQFERQIGAGGLGVVWRVFDLVTQRPLAIKCLNERFRNDAAAAQRLLREAVLTGMLQHPGVPPVYDHGYLDSGLPYFTMKLVEGATFDSMLERRSRGDADMIQRVTVFEHVAQTLAYAHSRRIIHRDLKPHNVMVGRFGEVQVLDWGFAKQLNEEESADASRSLHIRSHSSRQMLGSEPSRPPDTDRDLSADATVKLPSSPESSRGDLLESGLTVVGDVFGTPNSMAPEQARGDMAGTDTRTDVFGLGTILFHILTQRRLFEGLSAEDALKSMAKGDLSAAEDHLASLSGPSELVELCRACLQPEPADRPAEAGEVAEATTRYLVGLREKARIAKIHEVKEAAQRSRQELKLRLTMVLTAVLLLALGLVATQWRRADVAQLAERRARVRADDEARTTAEVNAFLSELLTSLRPERAGTDVTLRQVLDDFLPTIDDAFQDKPRIEGHIRMTLASTYRALGDTTVAEDQFRLAIRAFQAIRPLDELDLLTAQDGLAGTLRSRDKGKDLEVGSSRVDLQACKLEYSIVSPK